MPIQKPLPLAIRCLLGGILFLQALSFGSMALAADPIDLMTDRQKDVRPYLGSPDKVAELVRGFSKQNDWMGLQIITAPGHLNQKSRIQVPLEQVDAAGWVQIHEQLDIKYERLSDPIQTAEVIVAENGLRLCLIRETYNYQLRYTTADSGNPFIKFFRNTSDPYEDFGRMDVTCQSSYFIETDGHNVRRPISLTDCTETIRPNRRHRMCGVDLIHVIENPLITEGLISDDSTPDIHMIPHWPGSSQ